MLAKISKLSFHCEARAGRHPDLPRDDRSDPGRRGHGHRHEPQGPTLQAEAEIFFARLNGRATELPAGTRCSTPRPAATGCGWWASSRIGVRADGTRLVEATARLMEFAAE